MLVTVDVLSVLWIPDNMLSVDATAVSFAGLSILLLSGALSWGDMENEKGAWDTLIWLAALLVTASQLERLDLITQSDNLIGDSLSSITHGTNWVIILLLLNTTYFYTHYFLANSDAQIAALYAVFLGVGLHLSIPIAPTALMLAFISSLYYSFIQYTYTRGLILFGAGYVPAGVWQRAGFIISLFNQAVFIIVGLMWWRVSGLY